MKFVAITKIKVLEENKADLIKYLEKEYFAFLNTYKGMLGVNLYHDGEEVVVLENWDTLKNAKNFEVALIDNQIIGRNAWRLSMGTMERELYKHI